MKGRFMIAVVVFIVGIVAAGYCYVRLQAILPMGDPQAVTAVQAVIQSVHTPMIKKGQNGSDSVSEVRFAFEVQGRSIEGAYTVKGRTAAPMQGAEEPVVYLTADPQVFLRAAEYQDLPRQLMALRVMMVVFALAALVVPAVLMRQHT